MEGTGKGSYRRGLHELGDGLFAFLQPDGGWGLSNAGLVVADEIAIPMVIEAKEAEVVAMGSAVVVSASDAPWVPVVPVPALVPIPRAVTEVSAPALQSAVGNTTVGA